MREIFKPVLVLLIVCIVIAFSVAFVYNITKDTIAEIEKNKNEELMNEVLPDTKYDDITSQMLETVQISNPRARLNNVYKASKGYVFNIATKGYAGDVIVFVGINNDGTINKIQLGKNNETPSVGKKAEEKDFTDRFIGKNINQKVSEQVDTISGATITTSGVIVAVQEACDYFSSYNKLTKEEN